VSKQETAARRARAAVPKAKKVKRPARPRGEPVDDLESYIAERTERNPDFPELMEAAAERKRLLKALANARQAAGMSQTEVASLMETSTSAVARLEKGEANPTIATIQKFAAALGKKVEWDLS